jgi:hypothetical protein
MKLKLKFVKEKLTIFAAAAAATAAAICCF